MMSSNLRFFQPSEELLPGGASVMIADGALDGPKVDAIFGQHVAPMVPAGAVGFHPGAMMASADEIYITIRGKEGHAAMPQLAIDPIVAACELVMALQKVVSRTLDPFQPGVLTIGKMVGGSATLRLGAGEAVRLGPGDTLTCSDGLIGELAECSPDMRLLKFYIAAKAQLLRERTPDEIRRLEDLGPGIITRYEVRPEGDTRPVNLFRKGSKASAAPAVELVK